MFKFTIIVSIFAAAVCFSTFKQRITYRNPASKVVLASRSNFFGSFRGIFTSVDAENSKNSEGFESIAEEELDNAPAVLTDDICLLPGEPVVRIEEAPSNARRIFTGIDIIATIDDVWEVLTNYERLQDVVKSLVKNDVIYRTEQGARLLQVGGAKVLPGQNAQNLNFT